MGLDNVFVINLARRTERRSRMLYCLNELGLNATFIEATDGRFVHLFYFMYSSRNILIDIIFQNKQLIK